MTRERMVRCVGLAVVGGVWIAATGPAWAQEKAKEPAGPASSTAALPASSAATALLHPPQAGGTDKPAGEIFGIPVSMSNYVFAKRIAYIFPRPWGAADLPEKDREPLIWESLILSYESFRRGITATDDEVEAMVNELLQNQQQTFTRRGKPDEYHAWAQKTLGYDAELLENQVKFLLQIKKLKDQVREEQAVTATDAEMQREFLNEKNHVGGEMAVFDKQEDAQAFYEQMKAPAKWDAMKAEGKQKIRPVSLMTLEAYIDLWSVPQAQMDAFHALELGSVGEPMPFGKQWCVYRLLDKKTGDLKDFPKERDSYQKQIEMKKRFEGLRKWINDLKASAKMQASVGSSDGVTVAPANP